MSPEVGKLSRAALKASEESVADGVSAGVADVEEDGAGEFELEAGWLDDAGAAVEEAAPSGAPRSTNY